MLAELRITGLGVIDDAVIEPAPSFTAVTGETGAGKTMIVTALGLICGGRADSDRVRAGSRRAVVEARFAPGEPGAGGGSAGTAPAGTASTCLGISPAIGPVAGGTEVTISGLRFRWG